MTAPLLRLGARAVEVLYERSSELPFRAGKNRCAAAQGIDGNGDALALSYLRATATAFPDVYRRCLAARIHAAGHGAGRAGFLAFPPTAEAANPLRLRGP